LFGVAIGDALGVPVEFQSRDGRRLMPVTEMTGNGTYNEPAGTWSDDSALTFCLAESIAEGLDLKKAASLFVAWLHMDYWTATGHVFDVGHTTRRAIGEMTIGLRPELAGGFEESDNGNGSLMRILPLVFELQGKPVAERYELTRKVSSMTHGHIRAVIACFCYLEYALQLLAGHDKWEAYRNMQVLVTAHLEQLEINPKEVQLFDRILKGDISQVEEPGIRSGGYVMNTIEASLWCLLTTDDYAAAVLKAVNLGDDTDTTGAVTGGLAGLYYGFETIPAPWVQLLKRNNDIDNLCQRVAAYFDGSAGIQKE